QLDDRDGRLGRVARRDALERVGDEVPRAPSGLVVRLLFQLADAARELVADELLGTGEHLGLRLAQRQAGDALELLHLVLLGRLELLLELPRVLLAVGDPLLPSVDLGRAALDLRLESTETLL